MCYKINVELFRGLFVKVLCKNENVPHQQATPYFYMQNNVKCRLTKESLNLQKRLFGYYGTVQVVHSLTANRGPPFLKNIQPTQ